MQAAISTVSFSSGLREARQVGGGKACMIEEDKLLAGLQRVEEKVDNLQTAFEKKITEDEARFLNLEHNTETNTRLLADHAILHTQHARMISATQDLTLTKIGETLAKYQKSPAFKMVYYIGVALWGALTAYLAAHK